MKLLVLNGSSCSGKSTVIKHILTQKERYFHLSYDAIKWQFSQYASGSGHHEDIHTVMLSILGAVCELQYNVVTGALRKVARQKFIDVAASYGYEILEINLEADYEVVSKRFDERVAHALENPESRVANRSKEKFKELFEIYQREKNPSAITLRTDTQSVEQITERVTQLLE